jgi:predicted GTPase
MTKVVDPIASRKFPDEVAAWRSELQAIRLQLAPSDQLRIALVGTTGAGKSSLLNALLDQELLPVGVMEPCTAAPRQIAPPEQLDLMPPAPFSRKRSE